MLTDLIDDLADEVAKDLDSFVEVIEIDILDPALLVSSIPRWHATDDVVSVFCDLKNSAAARQYVRKVSGPRDPSGPQHDAFEAAVHAVKPSTAQLLDQLPEERQPPKTEPPLRRPEVRARIAAREAAAAR